MIFFVFVLLVSYGRYRIYDDVATYYAVVEIMSGLVCFFLAGIDRSRRLNRYTKVYILFCLFRIASSYVYHGSIYGEAKKIVYYEIGFLLVLLVITTKESYGSIMIAVRDFGVINAMMAIWEYYTKYNRFVFWINPKNYFINLSSVGEAGWRARTLFFHPSIFALFVCICWGITIFYPFKSIFTNNIVKIILAVALLVCNSRSGWVTFIVINLLIVIEKWVSQNNYTTRSTLYLISAMLIGGLLVFALMSDRVMVAVNAVMTRWVSGFSSSDVSNYNRITMIKLGLHEWSKSSRKTRLFGFGPGYAIAYLRANPIRGWNRAVDNTYITVLMNYGLIGLILYVYVTYGAIKNFFSSRESKTKVAAIICITISISTFFFDVFSWITCILFYCLAVMGLNDNESR